MLLARFSLHTAPCFYLFTYESLLTRLLSRLFTLFLTLNLFFRLINTRWKQHQKFRLGAQCVAVHCPYPRSILSKMARTRRVVKNMLMRVKKPVC